MHGRTKKSLFPQFCTQRPRRRHRRTQRGDFTIGSPNVLPFRFFLSTLCERSRRSGSAPNEVRTPDDQGGTTSSKPNIKLPRCSNGHTQKSRYPLSKYGLNSRRGAGRSAAPQRTYRSRPRGDEKRYSSTTTRRPPGGDHRDVRCSAARRGLTSRWWTRPPRRLPRLGTLRQGPLPAQPQPAGRHPTATATSSISTRTTLRTAWHDQTQELHQQRHDRRASAAGGAPARASESPIGFRVIIDNAPLGMLYRNQLFRPWRWATGSRATCAASRGQPHRRQPPAAGRGPGPRLGRRTCGVCCARTAARCRWADRSDPADIGHARR